MRVFEILKFFKALVAAEFQGLCEALPPAIEAYREAFVATAKYCANGFTCSDVAVRTRIKRHSFRSAPYRSRQRSAVVTPRRREDSADEDWLFPHLRHRRTRTSLVASFLESITPSNMMREIHVDEYLAEEDYVTKSSSCLSSFVSDDEDAETEEEDEEEDPVPPLLDVDEDDWDAFIPKVATITVDICVATTSESTTEEPEVPASTEDEGVSQPQADEGPEASLPSDDLSFECFGAHGPITTNVSYRQLTQEHAPAEGEAFYRVALQRLKLERQLRRRLRSSSEAWSITSSTSESANVQQLPTETKADDEAARARREKLALLRRQRTGFEIRVGYLKETSEVAEYAECGPDHSRSSTMSEEADAVAEAPLVAYV